MAKNRNVTGMVSTLPVQAPMGLPLVESIDAAAERIVDVLTETAESVVDVPQELPVVCIGQAVHYCDPSGIILPAFLQRQPITGKDPSVWDLKISLLGTGVMSFRAGVRYSAEYKAGYWSLPRS